MTQTLNGVIQHLKRILGLSCIMLAKMIITTIGFFHDIEQTIDHTWTTYFEGAHGLCWNILKVPTRKALIGIYARVIFLPTHYMVTFEHTFYTRFFKV